MTSRTKKSSMSPLAKSLMAGMLIVAFVSAWQLWAESGKKTTASNNITANVDTDKLMTVVTPRTTPQQIVDYTGYRASFNKKLHIPNWVAWELTRAETMGTRPREKQFWSDPKVDGCPEYYEYNYSGYDRGHMCPAGDMKWSKQSMHDSFSLTNICPQMKSLNTGAWKRLEEKCRTWAKADSAIIVVCGPVLTDPLREAIGDSRIAVPKRFFKVVLSPYAKPMRGIGFIMNNGYVEGGMQKAAVSIDEVERITGLDFFADLPDSIENIVESQCDFPFWGNIK